MLHPDLAAEIRRAMIAWRHVRTKDGQQVPTGWDAYIRVLDAAAAQAAPTSRWLTYDDAARHAGASTRTIRRWTTKGLPAHRVDNRTLIDRDELDAFIRRGGQPCGQERPTS